MIQRIQSLYLLLGALCLVSLAFIDSIWQNEASETLVWYVPAVAIVGLLTALTAVVAIFLYSNRAKQLKAVVAAQIMALGFMIVLYGGMFLAGEFDVLAEDIPRILALLLPIVAYILFYLARLSIQRDINLVKSMDRLR